MRDTLIREVRLAIASLVLSWLYFWIPKDHHALYTLSRLAQELLPGDDD